LSSTNKKTKRGDLMIVERGEGTLNLTDWEILK
jgi:hypothetical protein